MTSRARRLVALLAAVALVLLPACSDDDGDPPGPGASPSADASPPPATAGPGATPTPPSGGTVPTVPAPGSIDDVPVPRPPVPLDQVVSASGRTVSVLSLRAVQGQATGPGDVAGPALAVTVEVRNDSVAPIALDQVQVTLDSGTDRIPASPVNDPSATSLPATLDAGARAQAVLVFSLPVTQRDLVTVTVLVIPDQPSLVFQGPAPR